MGASFLRLPSASGYCVDVQKFGAVADGATDDRAAIISAFATAKTLGQAVRFGRSTKPYLISKYIDVADFRGLRIFGDGSPVIQYPSNDMARTSDGSSGPAKDGIQAKAGFIFRYCSDLVVEGIYGLGRAASGTPGDLNNLSTDNTGALFAWYHCPNITIRNCGDHIGSASFVRGDDNSDTTGTGDSLATVSNIVTLTDSAGAFRDGHVGMLITIANATHGAHNGVFEILSRTGNAVTWYNPRATAALDETSSLRWSINDGDRYALVEDCLVRGRHNSYVGSYGTFRGCRFIRPGNIDLCGSGDTFTFDQNAGTVTLTDAQGVFLPRHSGKYLYITGANSSGNNSSAATAFGPITYISATQISYPNTSGVTELFCSPTTASRNAGWWIIDGDTTGVGAGTSGLARTTVTGTGDSITFVSSSGISTLVDSAAAFTASMLYMPITITGSTGSKNNGTARILSVSVDGTTVTYEGGPNAANETSSFTWTVAYTTLTASAASFTAADSHKMLRILNPTSAANRGAWPLVYVSSTQVQFGNTTGVSETYAGPWSFDDYATGKDTDGNTRGSSHAIYFNGARRQILVEGCTFVNVRSTCVKASGSSGPMRDIKVVNCTAKDSSSFFIGGADDSNEHEGFLVDNNTLTDVATGPTGWSDGNCMSILGAQNVTISNNKFHFTRNNIKSLDGTGVGLSTIISGSRFVAGQSQPLRDVQIFGNKATVDPRATTPPKLFNTGISLYQVGLTAKYGSAGTLTKQTLTSTSALAATDIVTTTTAHGEVTGSGPWQLTTTGALPGGTSLATDYYLIALVTSTSQLKLATSFANAMAGTAVDLTSDATGTLTLTGPIMTLKTGDSLMSQEEVSKTVEIVFSPDSPNNGTFAIESVSTDGRNVTYRNASGVGSGSSSIGTLTSTSALASTDTVTTTTHGQITGSGPWQLATSGVLPGGTSLATDYYLIVLSTTTFKLATSYANAVAGTAVNLSSDATGTLTLNGPIMTYRIHRLNTDGGLGGTCSVYGNDLINAANSAISTTSCLAPNVHDNTFAGCQNNYTTTTDAVPRFYNNAEISANTTQARIVINGSSWPIIFDNPVTNQAIGVSSARGMGIGVNASTVYVDHPLLGKHGKVRPSDGKEEVVLAYGGEWVDGDTVTISASGTTGVLTYKTSAPGTNQFNSYASFLTAVAAIGGAGAFTADDYGTGWHGSTGASFDVLTYHARIRRGSATASTDGTLHVTVATLNPTAGIILRNNNPSTACYGRGSGSTGPTANRFVVWSPLVTYEGGAPQLVADNEAARTLLQANGYRLIGNTGGVTGHDEVNSGACAVLFTGTTAGTEELRWRL